ncbi:MAG: M3 family oligoendopeptidase [Desulfobulbaceae bacterium]|jgi:oligoendopeptidase F|nr:M3 family oligoendopeptidase [Desulfobulbaceae bacterium]
MDTRNSKLGTEEIIWNLADLYANEAALEADVEWCRKTAVDLNTRWRGHIATLSAAELLSLVSALEKLDSRLGRLDAYAFLNFCTQTDNAEAGALHQKITELCSECAATTIFFRLEWNALPEAAAVALLAAPELAPYRHYLTSLRRYAPHQLSEAEEKILLEQEPVGRASWNTLFEKIFAQMKFGETGRGEEEVLADLHRPEQQTRQRAAGEMTAALQTNSHILTHIFNTLAADKMLDDKRRRYPGWLSAMNLDNQVEDEVVSTMISVICSRYDLVTRYYHWKKKALGYDQLFDYDRYAPLPDLAMADIPWDECRQMVLGAFSSFSRKLHDIAKTFFDEGWIHACLQYGKRGGAFAHPVEPAAHPYLLVNYTGAWRDVETVAHEMGHGVHQVLAAGQGYYGSDTPLVLAETASVFAELLLFNQRLRELTDPARRAALIAGKLESIFATVFRQTAMNRFEERMHMGRRESGELSVDDLSRHWLETQGQMFGDAVTLTEDYGLWWGYIPHFLATPGYVYSYAFGELLTLSLYGRYQEEGEAFIGTYLNLLVAGGSRLPRDLLAPLGFNLGDPAFWRRGLAVIESYMAMLE